MIDGERGFGGMAAMYRGEVLIGSNDQGLQALNARTGSRTWGFFPPGGDGGFFGSPAVVNGVIYMKAHKLVLRCFFRHAGKPTRVPPANSQLNDAC